MKQSVARLLKEFPEALVEGVGAVFVGAGVSMGAGYPSWAGLLQEIGDELGVKSSDLHDLAALAQWSISESGGQTRVRGVIKEQISRNHPVPPVLEIVARLPVRHIWTTNYDRLVERSFEQINRPIDAISGVKDLALRATPGAARLYKMHGSVERLDDIVISTDDYELFRSRRGAFLPLLQAHLTSMSMLFIGLSFTDPNIRHVLSLIRESFTDAPPEHFAIVRPPKREDFRSDEEFNARSIQHKLWAKDLRRYGLTAVEIDSYEEVPALLRQIERRVAARRIWISGSWPVEGGGSLALSNYLLAENLGRWIANSGRDLVTGAGTLIGSATISGFLEALRVVGGWDIDRRLVVRPFPQPMDGASDASQHWASLRRELARQAGIVVFVGGAKLEAGQLITGGGVISEFEIARDEGLFLLPVGSSGGAAKQIAEALVGSELATAGSLAQRPSDSELELLSDPTIEPTKAIELIEAIVERQGR